MNIGTTVTLGVIAIELKTTVLCLFVVVCCVRCSGRSELESREAVQKIGFGLQYYRMIFLNDNLDGIYSIFSELTSVHRLHATRTSQR